MSRPALEFAKRHRHALVVLSLGFVLRLWLSPAPGYEGDVRTYQLWAKSAVKFGLAGSYDKQVGGVMLPNYPPLSMMIFAATGNAYETFVSRDFRVDKAAYRIVIKLPAMVADIATAALLYRLVRREGFRLPWLVPAIYLAHPAVFYDSAVWGQTDAIYSLFVVGALVAFLERRFAAFGMLLACAVLTKAQSVIVAPLATAVILASGRRPLARATLGALAVVCVVLAPFAAGGALSRVKDAYTGAVGFYPCLSSSAYNLWWALFGQDAHHDDGVALWGLFTYRHLGWTGWGLCNALVVGKLVRSYRRGREPASTLLFFAAAISAQAFFVLCTEMHERYLFPFLPLGLPVALRVPRFRLTYVAATLLYFLNMLGTLSWTALDRGFFASFPTASVAIATLQALCLATSLLQFGAYGTSGAAPNTTTPTAFGITPVAPKACGAWSFTDEISRRSSTAASSTLGRPP